jgi:transposase
MILGTSRNVRVFACVEPIDLRKGFDGLYGLVHSALKSDPLSGDLFLFVNRSRNGCKVLVWDGTGLCIFQKRLERGRFAELRARDGGTVTMTTTELALFIEGCAMIGARRLSPGELRPSARSNSVANFRRV